MDSLTLVALVFALLLGALGFALGRALAAGRSGAVIDSLRLQLDGVREERDDARAETSALRILVEEVREQRGRLASDLAVHQSREQERERAFAERLTEMERARDALKTEFKAVGAELLTAAQKTFLERADQRFAQAGESHEARIKALLDPVGEKLVRYEQQVERIEKERKEAYGDIRATIEHVRAGTERVQVEAARLVNSLRNAPKARGRWGEQQLRNVLESCGLSEHVDFQLEAAVATEDGRLRPDAVVRVPGGRTLVIDAKVSLNDYQDAFSAEDEETRAAFLTRHCLSMKAHVDGLARKAYWDQFADAPDYVIMFVPGEHFLAAALEHQPDLWDHAFERRVLLATPTNLVAIARTVAGVWRQEKVAKEAKEIARLGKDMYDRLAVSAEHLKRMGGGLSNAVSHYNKFVGSFERNVLSTGRRFAELNVETGKRDLEEVPAIEALPRYAENDGAAQDAALADHRDQANALYP